MFATRKQKQVMLQAFVLGTLVVNTWGMNRRADNESIATKTTGSWVTPLAGNGGKAKSRREGMLPRTKGKFRFPSPLPDDSIPEVNWEEDPWKRGVQVTWDGKKERMIFPLKEGVLCGIEPKIWDPKSKSFVIHPCAKDHTSEFGVDYHHCKDSEEEHNFIIRYRIRETEFNPILKLKRMEEIDVGGSVKIISTNPGYTKFKGQVLVVTKVNPCGNLINFKSLSGEELTVPRDDLEVAVGHVDSKIEKLTMYLSNQINLRRYHQEENLITYKLLKNTRESQAGDLFDQIGDGKVENRPSLVMVRARSGEVGKVYHMELRLFERYELPVTLRRRLLKAHADAL